MNLIRQKCFISCSFTLLIPSNKGKYLELVSLHFCHQFNLHLYKPINQDDCFSWIKQAINSSFKVSYDFYSCFHVISLWKVHKSTYNSHNICNICLNMRKINEFPKYSLISSFVNWSCSFNNLKPLIRFNWSFSWLKINHTWLS